LQTRDFGLICFGPLQQSYFLLPGVLDLATETQNPIVVYALKSWLLVPMNEERSICSYISAKTQKYILHEEARKSK
jgi:hypothetical protein